MGGQVRSNRGEKCHALPNLTHMFCLCLFGLFGPVFRLCAELV